MFKQYLQTQRIGIQFTIFLTIWIAFSLLSSALQPVILNLFGISVEDRVQFFQEEIFNHPNLLIVLNAIGALFLYLLPALVFAYLSAPQAKKVLGLNAVKKPNQLWIVSLMALGLISFISTLGGWLQGLNWGKLASDLDESRTAILNTYLSATSWQKMLVNIFFIALIPAVSEEFFFRGLIQKFIYSRSRKPWLSILITALVFALMHFSVREFIPIFLAGVLLSWVYYMTSSLYLSILLHLLNNGLQVVLIFIGSLNPQWNQVSESLSFQISLFIIGALILMFTIWLLQKNKTSLPQDWNVYQPES